MDSTLPKASPRPDDLGRVFAEIAEEAALVILPFWRADVRVSLKPDQSPVTEADERAEAVILRRLAEAASGIPVISEEAAAKDGLPAGPLDRFILVDPLDGTRGFVRGSESFTVNIALVENGVPVAGAVVAPATGGVWFTDETGARRRKIGERESQPIRARVRPADKGLALFSHSLPESEADRIAKRNNCAVWQAMDSSVKFCLIAEGRADVYPRSGPTCEWDTAAGDAVLRAAGGRVLSDDGKPMIYGKFDAKLVNLGFLALGA